MKNFSAFAAVGALLAGTVALNACGFQPLYANKTGLLPKQDEAITEEIAKIYVAPIQNRLGMIMRQDLQNTLAPRASKDKVYTLQVTNEKILVSEQGIRSDNIPTRITIGYKSVYTLRKGADVILQDSAFAQSSYNVLQSAYSTVTAEQDVEERIIKLLAQDIALRVTVFLKKYLQEHRPLPDSGES